MTELRPDAMHQTPRNAILRKSLDEIKETCLEAIRAPKNTFDKNPKDYLDFDDEVRTSLTQEGLLSIIDYVNLVMRKNDLTSGETTELMDSIITAIKACHQHGYENNTMEGKIQEIFRWAKVGHK